MIPLHIFSFFFNGIIWHVKANFCIRTFHNTGQIFLGVGWSSDDRRKVFRRFSVEFYSKISSEDFPTIAFRWTHPTPRKICALNSNYCNSVATVESLAPTTTYSKNPFSAAPFSVDFTIVQFVKEYKMIHLVRFLLYKFYFSAGFFWDFRLGRRITDSLSAKDFWNKNPH